MFYVFYALVLHVFFHILLLLRTKKKIDLKMYVDFMLLKMTKSNTNSKNLFKTKTTR